MVNNLCKYLFKRYRSLFDDLFLQDMVGQIPNSVNEPTSDFLTNAGAKLESWLLWQSHILQRKGVAEPQNSDIFRGMMLEIKIILMMAGRKKAVKIDIPGTKKEIDPNIGVDDFIKNAKKL